MNRRDLVRAVATHSGVDAREVETVLQGLTDVITAVVAVGEPVSIAGFAKFVKVDRPVRTKLDLDTQERIDVGPSVKPRIVPLKGFKDAVSGKAAAPSVAPASLALAQQRSPRSGVAGQMGGGQRDSQPPSRQRGPAADQNRRRNRSAQASRTARTGSSGKVAVASGQQRKPPRPSGRNRAAPRQMSEGAADSGLRRCGACGRERPAKEFPARFGGGICGRCRRRAARAKAAARKPAKRRSVWTVSGGGFESSRRRH